jgi:hypothetical protein
LPVLLTAARLSRSTFYYQIKVLETGDKYAGLKSRIKAVYERHKGRYGYRRITAELRQSDQTVNDKTVQRLMDGLGGSRWFGRRDTAPTAANPSHRRMCSIASSKQRGRTRNGGLT